MAAETYGIPLEVVLACGEAESNWYRYAERWGLLSYDAKRAIANGDYSTLQEIINQAWPDISFGYCQRIVMYHYYGDLLPTVENCLAVRQYVFDNPVVDIERMAEKLYWHYLSAQEAALSPVGGDVSLMTLCAYNAGHCPIPSSSYWSEYRTNIAGYKMSLIHARELLA